MQFPLSLWDVSLWLAVTSVILLATAELLSSHYGHTNLLVNKKRLEQTALALGTLFFITVAIRIYAIIASA